MVNRSPPNQCLGVNLTPINVEQLTEKTHDNCKKPQGSRITGYCYKKTYKSAKRRMQYPLHSSVESGRCCHIGQKIGFCFVMWIAHLYPWKKDWWFFVIDSNVMHCFRPYMLECLHYYSEGAPKFGNRDLFLKDEILAADDRAPKNLESCCGSEDLPKKIFQKNKIKISAQ